MHRIKISHRKHPGKTLLLFLLCLVVRGNAQTTTYYKAESFLFSFRPGEDLFLADYGDNAYQLERMGNLLDASLGRILKGDCHLLIISHVNAYAYEKAAVVNEASLRANRVRAYLKTRFDIPHECVAFYIDRSGNYRDRVHVYEVYKPLPWFANIAIHYSENRSPAAIEAAIQKYGAVPYVDLYRRGETGPYDREIYRIDDPLFDRTELEDYRLASVTDTVRHRLKAADSDVSLATTVRTKEAREIPHEKVSKEKPEKQMPPSVSDDTPQPPVYLAVKTNLLPWCGLVPSVRFGAGETKVETGAFMPNLEAECFFGGRWSVALSGMYADFSYKDKTRDRWSVSEISLEPRVWPLQADEFAWLNTGLFAEYGDFDVRGTAISPSEQVLYGRTGCFWSAGASVGSLIRLGAGFGAEISVRAGYRSVFSGKKYRYDALDNRNYLETRFASTGFMIGVKISLVYRFQIK